MRINDKIEEIEQYVEELEQIKPSSYEEYKSDIKTKAACERYFEKIIEAIIDLAFLLIKDNNFPIPEEDKKSFDILVNNNIIPSNLASKLKDAKGMRNILSHQYGKIDDELVFESITNEILQDTREFVDCVKNHP